MTLQLIQWKHGSYAPVIMCDFCHERIKDVKQGNAEWQAPTEARKDYEPDFIYHTHKHCSRQMEALARKRNYHWMNIGLEYHLGYLCHNVRFNQAEWEADPAREMLEGL